MYKYRDIKNDYHKRLLFNQELYFTAASSFNDPFDSTLPFAYDEAQLTEENIFLKYISILRRDSPNLSDTEMHDIAFDYQRRGIMKDEIEQERFNEKLIRDIDKSYGIVSLSKIPNDILMWSHYGNCHTGYCIGIDPKFIFINFDPYVSVKEIIYSKDLPRVDLFENPMAYFLRILSTKSDCWHYEKEVRLLYRNFVNKSLDITKEAIREVYLGAKMVFAEKQALTKELIVLYPNIQIFECNISKKRFEVDVARIA